MTFEELISKASALFNERGIQYALVGGVAASFYRDEKRTTEDVDFAVALSTNIVSEALDIARALGFEAKALTEAQLNGGPRFALRSRNRSPEAAILGSDKNGDIGLGFDVLLPSLPWVEESVKRAQSNTIEVLGVTVPVITPEDLLIAKLFAVNSRPDRDSDASDIRSILKARKDIDVTYLTSKVGEHKLAIPKSLQECFDYRVLRVARKNEKRRTQIG